MGFVRDDSGNLIDESTGQSYWLPGAADAPPPAPPEAKSLDEQALNPNQPLFATQAPSQATAPQPEQDLFQHEGVNQPGVITPPVSDFKLPPPKPVDIRNDALVNSPEAFSAAGGVASSREDVARLAGGVAQTKEAEAIQEQKAINENLKQQGLKNAAMSELITKTATEYDAKVKEIDAAAQKRLDNWQKMAEAQSKRVVDPQGAFHNAGGFTKALWALQLLSASQTKDSTASMGQVIGAVQNFVHNDIMAQKANIDQGQQSLTNQRAVDVEQDKMGVKSLDEYTLAANLRYKALDKALDSKIAAMGRPAAEAAGLLKAKAAVQDEILKVQGGLQEQVQKEQESKRARENEIYKIRLTHELKMKEEEYQQGKIDARQKTALDREHPIQALPTMTGLGLTATVKGTGAAATENGAPVQVKLKPNMTAKEATDATEVLTRAKSRATMLNEVRADIAKMSASDIALGGTPEFQQKVMTYIVPALKTTSGAAVTPEEAQRTMQKEFGFDITGNKGLLDSAGKEIKAGIVDEFKGSVVKAVKNNLRNLPTETLNELDKYIDPTEAQKYDLHFNPESTHVPEAQGNADTNAAVIRASGRADTNELSTRTPSSLVSQATAQGTDIASLVSGKAANPVNAVNDRVVKAYDAMAAAGRGKPGGLPALKNAKEENTVSDAVDDFANRSPKSIELIAKGYTNNKDLSDEAKLEILAEAKKAHSKAEPLEEKAQADIAYNFLKGQGPGYVEPNKDLKYYENVIEHDMRIENAKGVAGVPGNQTWDDPSPDLVKQAERLTKAYKEYKDSPSAQQIRTRLGVVE